MNELIRLRLERIANFYQIRFKDLFGKNKKHIEIRYNIYEILSPYHTELSISRYMQRHELTIKRAIAINHKRRLKNSNANKLYLEIKEIYER